MFCFATVEWLILGPWAGREQREASCRGAQMRAVRRTWRTWNVAPETLWKWRSWMRSWEAAICVFKMRLSRAQPGPAPPLCTTHTHTHSCTCPWRLSRKGRGFWHGSPPACLPCILNTIVMAMASSRVTSALTRLQLELTSLPHDCNYVTAAGRQAGGRPLRPLVEW